MPAALLSVNFNLTRGARGAAEASKVEVEVTAGACELTTEVEVAGLSNTASGWSRSRSTINIADAASAC